MPRILGTHPFNSRNKRGGSPLERRTELNRIIVTLRCKNKLKIGIIGGSGYVGGELLRLLLMHPQVEVTMVTSRQVVGEYVFNVHPNLRGLTQLKFVPMDIAELQKNCDLVFTATPHGGSVNLVPKLLEAVLKVIDMSADFRLKNPADYEKAEKGDRLVIKDVINSLNGSQVYNIENITKGAAFEVVSDLNDRQREIILKGGLLPYMKK